VHNGEVISDIYRSIILRLSSVHQVTAIVQKCDN